MVRTWLADKGRFLCNGANHLYFVLLVPRFFFGRFQFVVTKFRNLFVFLEEKVLELRFTNVARKTFFWFLGRDSKTFLGLWIYLSFHFSTLFRKKLMPLD